MLKATEVKFLGITIGTEGIKMDQYKVSATLEWPTLKNV